MFSAPPFWATSQPPPPRTFKVAPREWVREDWCGPFLWLHITYNGIKTTMCCCISVASTCRKSPIFPYFLKICSPILTLFFIQNSPVIIPIFSREVAWSPALWHFYRSKFFLQHRKTFCLVYLVIVTKIQREIGQLLRKLWRFWKWTAECDAIFFRLRCGFSVWKYISSPT